MKRERINSLFLFWCFCFLAVFGSCHRPVETVQMPSPDPTLVSIDSQMWQSPDSAFALLLDFASDPRSDSLGVFDGHYFQLLVSELLYKNDYEQTNRSALLQSVDYIDSLTGVHGGDASPAAVFLDARAHYIKGVGCYERDSVVEACAEYLKAVEVMEDRFPAIETHDFASQQPNHVNQFMALAYTRLSDVFSDQFLHQQAVYFAKMSLSYYYGHDVVSWHISRMLEEIGANYDMMMMPDSADVYYERAAMYLTDTNNLTFRDIEAHRALLHYQTNKNPANTLKRLYKVLSLSDSPQESCLRYLAIGSVYYDERQYDSAWMILNAVFEESANTYAKRQSAEWLVEICKHQGRCCDTYNDYLVPFANQEESQSGVKSLLAELYSVHNHKELEKQQKQNNRQLVKGIMIVIGILTCLFLAVSILYHTNKRKKRFLEDRLSKELHAHQRKQEALEESRKALQEQKQENMKLIEKVKMLNNHATWSDYDSFKNEPVCQEILCLIQETNIKREMKCNDYPEIRLSKKQLSQLETAVESHFMGFSNMLAALYPRIKRMDINQCMLCLLGLQDAQIAALLHNDYSTIKKRSEKLKKAFSTEKSLQMFLREEVL